MSICNNHHLTDFTSLMTSYEETRAGFIEIALERNRQATPYIAEAMALKEQASTAKIPVELLKNTRVFTYR